MTVLGPDPLLSITIEARGGRRRPPRSRRRAGRLGRANGRRARRGADPVRLHRRRDRDDAAAAARCAPRRATPGPDRRRERRLCRRPPELGAGAPRQDPATRPARHEVDDLVAATCAAALGSAALVVCNPFPADGFPDEIYETVVADVRAAGSPGDRRHVEPPPRPHPPRTGRTSSSSTTGSSPSTSAARSTGRCCSMRRGRCATPARVRSR